MTALILATLLVGQIQYVNALYPTTEPTPGVASGVSFCLDAPTCNTYCEDDSGVLTCCAGGGCYTWDGSEFIIPGEAHLEIGTGYYALIPFANGAGLYFAPNGVGAWSVSSTNLTGLGANDLYLVKAPGASPSLAARLKSDTDSGLSLYGGDIVGFTAGGNDTLVCDGSGTYDTMTVDGAWGTTTTSIQSLEPAGTISPNSGHILVVGQETAVTLTSNPQISDGFTGQYLIIEGTDDTDTLTIVDGNGVQLAGGVNFTLGDGDTLFLVYSSNDTDWKEVSRSNN